MASPNPDLDTSSLFMKGDGRPSKSPVRSASPRNRLAKEERIEPAAEVITVKDFFDFMKTAYQVYEHLEGDDDGSKINWEELTKLTVLNHVIEQQERDLLQQTVYAVQKSVTSKSETAMDRKYSVTGIAEKRFSCSEIEGIIF